MTKKEYDLKYQREKLRRRPVWLTMEEDASLTKLMKSSGQGFSALVKGMIREEQRRPSGAPNEKASGATETATTRLSGATKKSRVIGGANTNDSRIYL